MNFTLSSLFAAVILSSSPSHADEFSADLGQADINLGNTLTIAQQGHHNIAQTQQKGLQLSGAIYQHGQNNHILLSQAGTHKQYRITQRGHNLAIKIKQH